jgi:hypothetical protein
MRIEKLLESEKIYKTIFCANSSLNDDLESKIQKDSLRCSYSCQSLVLTIKLQKPGIFCHPAIKTVQI